MSFLPILSKERAPGNKLKPGKFPRRVAEAGVKTDESAPPPWEIFSSAAEAGLSIDDISSFCLGCWSPDS